MLRRVSFALARDGDVPRQRRYPLVRDIDLPAVGLRCALPQLRAARTRIVFLNLAFDRTDLHNSLRPIS